MGSSLIKSAEQAEIEYQKQEHDHQQRMFKKAHEEAKNLSKSIVKKFITSKTNQSKHFSQLIP